MHHLSIFIFLVFLIYIDQAGLVLFHISRKIVSLQPNLYGIQFLKIIPQWKQHRFIARRIRKPAFIQWNLNFWNGTCVLAGSPFKKLHANWQRMSVLPSVPKQHSWRATVPWENRASIQEKVFISCGFSTQKLEIKRQKLLVWNATDLIILLFSIKLKGTKMLE